MKKILIANRGEIAVRVIRACREMNIETVAVHSVADRDSLHAKLADESVCIGPGPSAQSYLHIPAVMSAAEVTGADAIHPGYGFLSENAEFARICEAHGLKFIGPRPEHIQQLGDKVAARELAQSAKVPLLPGSDGALASAEEARAVARDIGFPVIIKAAAGGGGRGMKIVRKEEDLANQLEIARTEAQSYFGNPACFVERYLENPRHVEVQLLADEHGSCVALGERDCSIQHRHQKLVEEAPCSVLSPELRAFVCERAVNLAKSVGYQSLGTAEFLYENGQFYFMEMNTRIQVEHPVTELVTGLDLVKEQIRVAQGEKLRPELVDRPLTGHAIECRINAEDPYSFAPWPGLVTAYHEAGGPGVRMDSMLYNGYRVPSLYDSMVAKLITHGADRDEAMARMRRALAELQVDGIRTNAEFHRQLLAEPRFQDNDISTGFLQTFRAKPPADQD